MPHRRHIPKLIVSVLGLLSLGFAFYQGTHPPLAIIETTGQVVDLVRDSTSPPAAPRYHPVIFFRTANGDTHVFTADFSQTEPAIRDPTVPATYRTHIGATVPIQYFPWAPQEAELGAV